VRARDNVLQPVIDDIYHHRNPRAFCVRRHQLLTSGGARPAQVSESTSIQNTRHDSTPAARSISLSLPSSLAIARCGHARTTRLGASWRDSPASGIDRFSVARQHGCADRRAHTLQSLRARKKSKLCQMGSNAVSGPNNLFLAGGKECKRARNRVASSTRKGFKQ
jgi:hypothetical protein